MNIDNFTMSMKTAPIEPTYDLNEALCQFREMQGRTIHITFNFGPGVEASPRQTTTTTFVDGTAEVLPLEDEAQR